MNKTKIEWTDYTWNPVTGCTKVSQGCKNCYAETLTTRFGKQWGMSSFRDVQMHPERLNEPLKIQKQLAGKKVFVCDMSDLFHEAVSFEFIWSVYCRIAICKATIFQILTKRPDRALEFYKWFDDRINQLGYSAELISPEFPLPNLWIGTSVENQETADDRIPVLLQIPGLVRFLSCEPLLGPIDLEYVSREGHTMSVLRGIEYDGDEGIFHTGKIDWVIAGGESGHGARPMHPEWIRVLRDQCKAARVPFFFKQWGEYIDNQNMPYEHASGNYKQHVFEAGYFSTEVWKLGKSKTGNVLDGTTHLEFPTT